ncbi:MAG TPA: helix-turn-helix domain-containing protein [Sporichthyaceae bacterium]|jgi:DNA invertase Pin-like site-specific DNA recombinase|nr:helix-turn-helix domain-containing protein [Sporichthyaceae bacterium]
MTGSRAAGGHAATFAKLRDVRERALEHVRLAQQLAAEPRDIMRHLIEAGVSQSEIARELGVSRQAVQKMLAC